MSTSSSASPNHNGSASPVASVAKTGNKGIDGLLSGVKWASSISYSAPDKAGDYPANHPEWLSGLTALTSQQLKVVHGALGVDQLGQPAGLAGFSVEGFTNLSTSFKPGGSGAGTIRLANTLDPYTAYAYYPSKDVEGGDVFFGPSGDKPVAGNYDYVTIIHEIGHALGLKHPHESASFGASPSSLDAMQYSVMSYRSYPGASTSGGYTNETWGYAQSYMTYDIAALQHMYGADYSTNSGNTTYSWNPTTGATLVNGKAAITPGANRIFLTVWDGGGNDTYDLSAYATSLKIDLRPGASSTFSSAQLANLDIYGNHKASGNVWNAFLYKNNPASLIENVLGGKGADRIYGNDAANALRGNAGNDFLDGGNGKDKVYGGAGDDQLTGGTGVDQVIGGSGNDTFRFYTLAGSPYGAADTLLAGDGGKAFDSPGKAKGDVIDVSPLDADVTVSGNQAFKWGATTQKAKGYLWVGNSGQDTHVYGNIDTDSTPEFQLKIADGTVVASAYSAADFIL